MKKIGFMQGRLSKMVNNQIQAFPFEDWVNEFKLAGELNLNCMEWTLDYPYLKNNPLLIKEKKGEIEFLSKANNISINSVTLDCCMQRPFWKTTNAFNKKELINDFKLIINSAGLNGIKLLILPLVDNGSINNNDELKQLIKILSSLEEDLKKHSIRVAFESDYPPLKLLKFINQFSQETYGINYDTGNSASLGFDSELELELYGSRVLNVHIKDRLLGGTTVRLGEGNAEFEKVFRALNEINYSGNFILQTARSKNNEHFKELEINLKFLNALNSVKFSS